MKAQKLEVVFKDFYQISGLELALMSKEFRAILSQRCPYENFCAFIHNSSSCLEICKNSDEERFLEVIKLNDELTYTCPFGISEMIVPIRKDDEITDFLIASLGIVGRSDKEICENLKHMTNDFDEKDIYTAINLTTHLTDEALVAYKTMVRVIANYIENEKTEEFNAPRTIPLLTKRYIKNNLSKKITLSDISWQLHCSTVTLTEHFKKEFGITIMQYVAEKKMFLAEKMLADERNNVNDVAEACGFSDVEYFSRCFKGYHGVSPLAWRKQNRIENERKQNTEDSAMDTGHS